MSAPKAEGQEGFNRPSFKTKRSTVPYQPRIHLQAQSPPPMISRGSFANGYQPWLCKRRALAATLRWPPLQIQTPGLGSGGRQRSGPVGNPAPVWIGYCESLLRHPCWCSRGSCQLGCHSHTAPLAWKLMGRRVSSHTADCTH